MVSAGADQGQSGRPPANGPGAWITSGVRDEGRSTQEVGVKGRTAPEVKQEDEGKVQTSLLGGDEGNTLLKTNNDGITRRLTTKTESSWKPRMKVNDKVNPLKTGRQDGAFLDDELEASAILEVW